MPKYLKFEELLDLLRNSIDKKVLLTFHSIGDRDSVSSALVLSKLFPNSVVATPDFITASARREVKELSEQVQISNSIPNDTELVIVLDANTTEAIGSFGEKVAEYAKDSKAIFIDHHVKPAEQSNAYIYNNENYNSASSIVYDIIKQMNLQLDRDSSLALLNGIIADSAEFRNMSSNSFRQIADILEESNMNYSQVLLLIEEHVPLESRLSLLNDIKKAKVDVVGDYIFMYGRADMHANVIADMAIRMGADASVFWVEKSEDVSMSARLKVPLDVTLNMHLGKIMQKSAHKYGLHGGGHPCAAGAYGKSDNNEGMAQEIVEQIRDRLKEG